MTHKKVISHTFLSAIPTFIQIISELLCPHCKEAGHKQQADHGLVHVATLLEGTVSLSDSCECIAM